MSIHYPEITLLDAQWHYAARRRQEAVRRTFMDKPVRVNHYRGTYTGVVVGISYDGRVVVRNDRTGKTSARDPLGLDLNGRPQVELLG